MTDLQTVSSSHYLPSWCIFPLQSIYELEYLERLALRVAGQDEAPIEVNAQHTVYKLGIFPDEHTEIPFSETCSKQT